MKKLFILIVAILATMLFFGCSKEGDSENSIPSELIGKWETTTAASLQSTPTGTAWTLDKEYESGELIIEFTKDGKYTIYKYGNIFEAGSFSYNPQKQEITVNDKNIKVEISSAKLIMYETDLDTGEKYKHVCKKVQNIPNGDNGNYTIVGTWHSKAGYKFTDGEWEKIWEHTTEDIPAIWTFSANGQLHYRGDDINMWTVPYSYNAQSRTIDMSISMSNIRYVTITSTEMSWVYYGSPYGTQKAVFKRVQ